MRAAGYDASWHPDIADWGLIRLARREERILLSSDPHIFRIGLIRDREIPALWIPHGLGTGEPLAFVLRHWQLPLRMPRCRACGGTLAQGSKDEVREHVPLRSFQWAAQFWRCEQCGKIFWQGTHWQKIDAGLRQVWQAAQTGKDA